tara:strand:+ start:2082 stop:2375 length:294 start_codon:yes stop_codon:yes gene_type:complete
LIVQNISLVLRQFVSYFSDSVPALLQEFFFSQKVHVLNLVPLLQLFDLLSLLYRINDFFFLLLFSLLLGIIFFIFFIDSSNSTLLFFLFLLLLFSFG